MKTTPKSRKGDPPWELAQMYPDQGYWEEEDYLDLDTNKLVEFSNGCVEVLLMPTMFHQVIAGFLYRALFAFVEAHELGKVLSAPMRVRLWPRKFREPDVIFMLARHSNRMTDRFWKGADLAMEVVSDDPESRHRDLVKKRREYAKARILEYWIVDPKQSKITVLKLQGKKYVVAGEHGPGSMAKSILLKGFEVAVDAALAGGTANGRKK